MDVIKDGRSKGFTTIENAVIDTADLNVLEKMVYLVLTRFMDSEDASCAPTVENIAVRLGGAKVSQVKSALEGLIKKQYVEKESCVEECPFITYYMLDLPESVGQFGDTGIGGI